MVVVVQNALVTNRDKIFEDILPACDICYLNILIYIHTESTRQLHLFTLLRDVVSRLLLDPPPKDPVSFL